VTALATWLVVMVAVNSRVFATNGTVYTGGFADTGISVPGSVIGNPLDIAYCAHLKRLFIFAQFGDALRVAELNAAGKTVRAWPIPSGLGPTTALHIAKGQLCLVMYDKATFGAVLLRLARSTDAHVVQEPLDPEASEHYDSRLDAPTARGVRQAMATLAWYPAPHTGQHILAKRDLLESFRVNAPFVDDRIAWKDGLTALCFGWDFGPIRLATRSANGDWIGSDVRSSVVGALESRGVSAKSLELIALSLTDDQAVIGVATALPDKSRDCWAVWLPLPRGSSAVLECKRGYVARQLRGTLAANR
jgi:hypothetical protein